VKGRWGWQANVGDGAALCPNLSITSPLTLQTLPLTNSEDYKPLDRTMKAPHCAQHDHFHWLVTPISLTCTVYRNLLVSLILDYIRRVQPERCNVSQFIYFCKTLYMFQTVFLSIIRSSKLHIQRQVLVWQIPDALCAVLSSWWWTEKLSETCRASYRNK